ncbi:hypothetical protein LCGC14_2173230 [marine sediment metagenome]|uniref:Uncharacterized protein n=1 Tax=marine sediment metagenome TaxID=412755 RepID=A0A0F9DPH3_9ZZZZ
MRSSADWIKKYMTYVENTEPPLLYHEWTAVMTIAGALQRKCWMRWGIEDTLYPNLYTVIVGPAGCRKGTAMKVGSAFLKSLGIRIAPSSVTREALIRLLAGTTVQETAQDGTHISHASLTIWSPEWSVFLGGRENMQLIMDLTDWYDCANDWDYVTKHEGEDSVQGVWVNMFGAITPSTIKSVLPIEAVGAGLASRIVFVYEERPAKRVPDPFETPELEAIREELVNDLTDIHALSGEFRLTPNASDFYTDWYLKMESTNPDLPPTFEGYLNRRQTHLRKLAMIMCTSESDDKHITENHFKRALDLLERTEVTMLRVFSGMGSARDSQLLDDLMIYIARHQRVSAADIFIDFRSFLSGARHFDDLINQLVRQRFCTQDVSAKGTFIVYNPNNPLHKQYGLYSSRSSNASSTP